MRNRYLAVMDFVFDIWHIFGLGSTSGGIFPKTHSVGQLTSLKTPQLRR